MKVSVFIYIFFLNLSAWSFEPGDNIILVSVDIKKTTGIAEITAEKDTYDVGKGDKSFRSKIKAVTGWKFMYQFQSYTGWKIQFSVPTCEQ